MTKKQIQEQTAREILGIIDARIAGYEALSAECKRRQLVCNDIVLKLTALQKIESEIQAKYNIYE